MFGAKISSVLAGGILVLGSSAIALAQGSGPPEELPEQATQHAQRATELSAEVQDETTETVGDDGGATAFSEWVESLSDESAENHLEGCERGLTIAANAKNGPTDFETAVPADPDHPAFTNGNCTDGGEAEVTSSGATAAEQGQDNRPADADEQGGRDTADEARGHAGQEGAETGAEAAEQGQDNRPQGAGEQGGRDRAPDRP